MKKDIFELIKETMPREDIKNLFKKEVYIANEEFKQKKYKNYLQKIGNKDLKTAQKGK